MTKALALVSGGLDSILAARLIKDQGIDVVGICFKSAFFGPENAMKMAKVIDIPLRVIDFTEEHIKLTRNPKHGYGKNMNPCIDCHALMLSMAGKLMEDMGADFLITGEVLNQRPMSQTRQSLDVVKRESGYSSKILRPLCAKNLPPTAMEEEGLVDREKLMDISGRSRKVQMELAKSFGIEEYPSPAGGCSLTEPNFSNRLRDLYDNSEEIHVADIELLRIGRHFRLSPKVKLISTRNAEEYEKLKGLIREEDMIFEAVDYKGSTVLLRGTPSRDEALLSASIAARYSKGNGLDEVIVAYRSAGRGQELLRVKPSGDEDIKEFLL